MTTLLCLAVVAAVVVVGAEAQRPGGGGRRLKPGPPRPRPPPAEELGEISTWNRTVDDTVDDTDVSQNGISISTDNVVIVKTRGQNLTSGMLYSSNVMYLFGGASPMAAIRRGRGRACFVIPGLSGETFNSTANKLAIRNGTTVTDALTDDQRSALGTPLDTDEATALFESNPGLGRFCRGARVVETVQADPATFPSPGSEPEDQKVVSFLTLNSKVSLLVNTPPPRPASPGGGRRPGRPQGRNQGRPQGRNHGRPGRTQG
ncbi:uncharacterized protein [Littorina saxatilis]|uniref:uncharacterized protein n=1 Tax=Littorina saxatilis TaxID=31220 RepID=UPI0038B675AE